MSYLTTTCISNYLIIIHHIFYFYNPKYKINLKLNFLEKNFEKNIFY